MEETDHKWLGPVKGFFLFHVLDNILFWLGLVLAFLYINEGWASAIYNSLAGTPAAGWFGAAYDWGYEHNLFWWGVLFVAMAVIMGYIHYKVTRFVIEKGTLVMTRGKFSLNPFAFFQRVDYTVALNLVYDVDVKKTLFQYIFGGGDVYIRTASTDIFHLEFVEDPHALREYLIEHSGIKNKPVIGVY